MKTLTPLSHFQYSPQTKHITLSNNRFLPAPLRAILTVLLLVTASCWVSPRALAQLATASPPERMTYQGFLADGNGIPLAASAPKNYDVVFRIWNDASLTAPANRLWTEQQTVTVDKGYFSVLLGEGTAVGAETYNDLSTLFTNATASDRYVEMTVLGIGASGNPVTMLPRLRLMSSPYAFLARSATKLVGASGGDLISSPSVGVVNIAGTLNGDGSGLTGLTSSQIPNLDASKITSGTLTDARLSANVAVRNAPNTFISDYVAGRQRFQNANNYAALIEIFNSNTSSLLQLGVDYGVNFSGFSANGDGVLMGPAGKRLLFQTSYSTPGITLDSAGSVGIGTTVPEASLHVVHPSRTAGQWGFILDNSTQASYRGGIRMANVGFLEFTDNARNANPNYARLDSTGNFTAISDVRRKKDITSLTGLLPAALNLRPVRFHFKEAAPGDPLQIGFIAQEVRKQFPSLVTEGDYLTLNYSGLSVVAIGAIKELYEVVRNQEVEIASLRSRLTEIETKDKAGVGRLPATADPAERIEKLETLATHLSEIEPKAARVETLEHEVADLKKMVAQLAEVSRASKKTALVAPASQPAATMASVQAAPGAVRLDR